MIPIAEFEDGLPRIEEELCVACGSVYRAGDLREVSVRGHHILAARCFANERTCRLHAQVVKAVALGDANIVLQRVGRDLGFVCANLYQGPTIDRRRALGRQTCAARPEDLTTPSLAVVVLVLTRCAIGQALRPLVRLGITHLVHPETASRKSAILFIFCTLLCNP